MPDLARFSVRKQRDHHRARLRRCSPRWSPHHIAFRRRLLCRAFLLQHMTGNMRLCQAPLTPEKSQSPFLRQTVLLQKNRQSGKKTGKKPKWAKLFSSRKPRACSRSSLSRRTNRAASRRNRSFLPLVLVVVLTASCCLLGYHLQCVQKSLSAANRSILEASSYLRTADERLDRYVDYIEEYIPRKYVSFVDRFSYSRTFESYQRSHPIPDPDPYPWNK